MTSSALIWTPRLAEHDLGDSHPFDPRRLALAVQLMSAYGLLSEGRVIEPRPATDDELLLVHSSGYIEVVRESSDWGTGLHAGAGLGTEDNPIYPGMHEFAALGCGASIVGLDAVLSGDRMRTFSIAGGLHHAHRGRAAGFSVYNDPAVAIAVARQRRPGTRVLYVDIDAHHGDGVQEAFYGSNEVLTISVHESGLWLFPGTGFPGENGYGEGEGYAVNVPLPPLAGDASYEVVFERVVKPLAEAFEPDVIVAQLGVDAHHLDPQADLVLTIPGYRDLVRGIIGLADDLCEGRLAALGGGGYNLATVPRAWTWVMAELLGVKISETVPEAWRARAPALGPLGLEEEPRTLGLDDRADVTEEQAATALDATEAAIAETRAAVFERHGLSP